MIRFFVGILRFLWILFGTVVIPVMICIFTPCLHVLLKKNRRQRAMRFVHHLTDVWIWWIEIVFFYERKKKIIASAGPDDLNLSTNYLLICNHQNWTDILILGFALRNRAPVLRFFLKKELLWFLPFGGLAAWFLGYPFVHRITPQQARRNPKLKKNDLEVVRCACAHFKTYPAVIVNYVEGTRFNEKKKQAQDAPYQNLLRPKASGIATVLNVLNTSNVINATLLYEPRRISVWNLCCGNFKKIMCRYELLPPSTIPKGDYAHDRNFRVQFQNWLNQLWHAKDQEFSDWKKNNQVPDGYKG